MKPINHFKEIFLYQKAVDMRKQINGLSAIVEQEMRLSPFIDALFVFLNQEGTIIKFLYWDRTGFAIWNKRLEKEKYARPILRAGVVSLNADRLQELLYGLNIFQQGHRELHFEKIC